MREQWHEGPGPHTHIINRPQGAAGATQGCGEVTTAPPAERGASGRGCTAAGSATCLPLSVAAAGDALAWEEVNGALKASRCCVWPRERPSLEKRWRITEKSRKQNEPSNNVPPGCLGPLAPAGRASLCSLSPRTDKRHGVLLREAHFLRRDVR